jgi:glycosyltransferase involved in cell wall biosynthesis
MRVLAVLVGAAARTGGPPAFAGGSAVSLAEIGTPMRIVATDLALAPWGWGWRPQRRITREEMHPTLAVSDTHLFAARFPRRLAFSPALARALREMAPDYDVMHLHNLWQFPQYAGYRAAVGADRPYVVSPHGALDPFLRRRGVLRKRLTTSLWQGEMLDRAAVIHVTTRAEERLISDVAPHVPRVVVPCGLDVGEFADLPPRETFRRERLGGYDGPVILFLGRITQKKGVDVLIRAFAHARRTEDCRLVIVGPDDEGLLPALRRLADDLHVRDDVEFLAPVYGEDRLAALATADVWALSSHTENFGIAVAEAMAAGRAVVASPGVNLAEDIAAADAGMVVEAGAEPFGEALTRVIRDSELRARLERRAPKFAARYDWSVVAPELLEMYRRAAALAPSA